MAKLPIPFNNPRTYAGHSGVDYPVPRGTAIPASGPGRVTTLSRNAAGGFYIWVQYDNGPLVGYHHMDSHNGCPPVNGRVSEGTLLGYVGNTGNSTGPHLHSEVAGHRTTAGYWLFFDSSRVVGSSPAGGGGSIILFSQLPTDYIRALQSQLGVDVDGIVGPGTISAIQKKVGATVDGKYGPNTLKAIQKFIGTGADGIWGAGTTAAFKFAIDAGRFGQPLHVLIGDAHTRKLQAQLGVSVDGIAGNGTISALQRKVGAGVDGIFGRGTMSKLQAFVGAGVDGIWGPDTANKVRAAIDASKFGTVITTPAPEPEIPTEPEVPAGTVFGIDVAWPQTGTFDWVKVNEKQDFVIIKAAGAEGGDEGIYGPAELLDKHLAGARTTNMRVGFYFFNNNRHPVKAQADKFIEVLKPRIRPGDFVALDIEDVGTQKVAFNPDQALEFAEYIRKALDIRTFMYLNRSHVNGADWSKVVEAGHPLWLATLDGLTNGLTYLLPNSVKWWGNASIVQFSSTTKIDGYSQGPVDQNIGFENDISLSGFVAFPITEEPEEPTDEGEAPPWFKRFLEGLIDFLRAFLGAK